MHVAKHLCFLNGTVNHPRSRAHSSRKPTGAGSTCSTWNIRGERQMRPAPTAISSPKGEAILPERISSQHHEGRARVAAAPPRHPRSRLGRLGRTGGAVGGTVNGAVGSAGSLGASGAGALQAGLGAIGGLDATGALTSQSSGVFGLRCCINLTSGTAASCTAPVVGFGDKRLRLYQGARILLTLSASPRDPDRDGEAGPRSPLAALAKRPARRELRSNCGPKTYAAHSRIGITTYLVCVVPGAWIRQLLFESVSPISTLSLSIAPSASRR